MTFPQWAADKMKRAAAKRAKKKAKQERLRAKRNIVTSDGRALTIPPRMTLRSAKEMLKSKLHAAIRERDGPVCISCGKTGLVAGQPGTWHAGHLFAVGPFPSVELHPQNISSQCAACNSTQPRFGGRMGNHAAYAAEFIRRYDLQTFMALEEASKRPTRLKLPDLVDLIDILHENGLRGYTIRYFELTTPGVQPR